MDMAALQTRLREFAHARDWEQFHTPKNLAMALAAEAGELLEIFQWLTDQQAQAIVPKAWSAVGRKPLVYDIVYDDGLFDDGALSDPDVHEVIVPAVEELATRNWQSGGALRGVLASWLARRPAGDHTWLGSAGQPPRCSQPRPSCPLPSRVRDTAPT